jgi:hypothetical protein
MRGPRIRIEHHATVADRTARTLVKQLNGCRRIELFSYMARAQVAGLEQSRRDPMPIERSLFMFRHVPRAAVLAAALSVMTNAPAQAGDYDRQLAKDLGKAQQIYLDAGLKGDKAKLERCAEVIRILEEALDGHIIHFRPEVLKNDTGVRETEALIDAAEAATNALTRSAAGRSYVDTLARARDAALTAYGAARKRAIAAYRDKMVQDAMGELAGSAQPAAAEKFVDTKVEPPNLLERGEIFKRPADKPKKKHPVRAAKKTTAPSSRRTAPPIPRQAAQQPIGRLESGAGGGH